VITIKTGSWYTKIPGDYIRVSISRGSPRGIVGYKTYRPLAPGAWFNSISDAEYLTRYEQLLTNLDPAATVAEIEALAGDKIPVLCCFETIAKIAAGSWCHRHLVKLWLEHHFEIEVPEVGVPEGFNLFKSWDANRITLPWRAVYTPSTRAIVGFVALQDVLTTENSANSAFGSTSERPYTLRKRVRGDPGLPITTN
jgi:hypothetical protein